MGNFSEGKKSIIFFKCFDNYCFIKNLISNCITKSTKYQFHHSFKAQSIEDFEGDMLSSGCVQFAKYIVDQ